MTDRRTRIARARLAGGLAMTSALGLAASAGAVQPTGLPVAAQPAIGQPASSPPVVTPVAPPETEPLGTEVPWPAVTVDEALGQVVSCPPDEAAMALERLAILDLRLQPTPTLEDFELAGLALEAAAGLDPDDADLWRRVAEAAFNTGDQAALERATRQVVRLDPADTVAQLRLITMRVARLQTGAERLAAYERLLAAGSNLDASVRSRLALDAAVIAREMGDQDGFVRLLTQAAQLDSTNKEAAALALAYYQASVPEDPIGRLQLMCNLLLADPLDPHVHLAIASELSAHAAFDRAARFHNNARAIIGASDAELAALLDVRGLILNWQLAGPEFVANSLSERLGNMRHEAAYSVRLMEERGITVRDEERPENTRLNRELGLVRLMAADAAGYREAAAEAAKDLTGESMEVIQYYQRPENLPTGEAGRELAERIVKMWIETLVVRAWSSADMEALATDLETSMAQLPGVDFSEAKAWFGLRTGQQDQVIEFFRQSQGELYRSRLGYAMALEAQGRTQEAIEVYVQVAREDPAAVQSAWARSRLLFMTGQDLARTEFYDEAIQVVDQVPAELDAMMYDASQFMRLHASVPAARVGPLERTNATATLTNRGTIPLAVGSVRPIDSRVLLSPQVRVGSIPVIGAIQPEVLDLDRRLRLKPGESITASLPLEVGFTEAFVQSQSASRTGTSWRVIQGFRIVEEAYVPGPLCLAATTPEVTREPLLLARLSPEDLAVAASQAPDALMPAVARAAWGAGMSDSYGRGATPQQLALVAAALGERYARSDARTRLILLGSVPTAALAPGFEAFDDAVRASAATETDPGVLMAALLTRATTPDDPIIAACRASAEPWLARAGQIQSDRLAAGGSTSLSTVGPGMPMLMGPSLPSLRGVVE